MSHQELVPGANDPHRSAEEFARQERAFSDLAGALGESVLLDDLHAHAATCVRDLVSVDRVILGVVEPATDTTRIYIDSAEPDANDAAAATFIERIRQSGQPARFDELPEGSLATDWHVDEEELESGWSSVICAPLVARGEVIGAIAALSRTPDAYADADLDLLTRIAQVTAGVAANVLTVQQMEREIQEREILSEIGRVAGSTLDLKRALDGAFEKLEELIPADRVSIMVQPAAPRYVYERGLEVAGQRESLSRRPASSGLPAVVANSGESLLVDDLSTVLDIAPGTARIVASGLKSAIMAPFISTGEVVGVVAVCATELAAYSEHDLRLLERIALQLTGTVVNTQLHSAVEQQARHEALLAEVGRVATSTTTIESVFAEISRVLGTVTDFDNMSLSTIDRVRGTITVRFAVGDRLPGFGAGDEQPLEASHAGEVVRAGSGVIVTGTDLDSLVSKYEHLGEFLSRNSLRTRMVVPIIHGDESVGSLSMHSRLPEAYSLLHLNLVQQIAAQISGAVANALLRSELSARADEEEILADIGLVITSSPDFDEVFGSVADLLARRLQFDRIALGNLDWETGVARTRYAAGIPLEGFAPGDINVRPVEAMNTPFMTEDGGIFDSSEIISEVGTVTEADAIKVGLVAGMSVHLRSAGVPVGEITIRSKEPDAYNQRDLDFFRRVAAQLSGAFANSELHAEAESRAREETILAKIGREIGSPLDADAALERIQSDLAELVPAERVTIAARSVETGAMVFLYGTGIQVVTGHGDDDAGPTDGGIAEMVLESGEPHVINDIPTSGDQTPGIGNLLKSGLKSAASMPLIWDSETIGVLGVSSSEEQAYGQRQVELLRRVTDQLAGWVANGRLLASLEQQARIDALMAEIGRLVNSSIDIEDVYEQFAVLAVELVPADRIVINTIEEDGTFRERYLHGPQLEGRHPDLSMPLEGSFTGLIAQTGVSQNWSRQGAARDAIGNLPVLRPMLESGFSDLLGTPLGGQGEVFGVLHFARRTGRQFSEADQAHAEAVASQIAGGIIGEQLREQASDRAIEEAMLAEISQVVSSSLNLEDVFPGFAEKLSQLMPAEKVWVNSIHRERGEWVDRYHWYSSGAAVEFPSTGPLHGSATDLVARTGEIAVFGSPGRGHHSYLDYPGLVGQVELGTRSSLLAPLIVGSDVIGVLAIHSRDEDAYTPAHIALCSRVASLVASAMSNVTLLEEAEANARERGLLAEIGRLSSSSLEIEEMAATLAGPYGELVPHDRIAIATYEPDGNQWTVRHLSGVSVEGDSGDGRHSTTTSPTSDAVGRMVETAGPIVIPDHSDETNPLRYPEYPDAGLLSTLLVPLVANGRVVGLLAAHSGVKDAFDAHHVDLSERVALQISGAFDNAALHEQALRDAEERSVLADIGRLASASLDFGNVFDRLAVSVARLLPYDRFVIHGIDEAAAMGWTQFVVGRPVEGWGQGTTHAIEELDQSTRDRRLGGIRNLEPDAQDTLSRALRAARLNSYVGAPMVWEDRVVGSISVRSEMTNAYTQHHRELMVRVAQQITGAFVNSELHAITAQESAERRALAEIGRLASSSLEVTEMFEAITEPVSQLLPHDRMAVTTFDPATGMWTTRFVAGERIDGFEPGDSHPDNQSALRQALNADAAFIGTGDERDGPATAPRPARTAGMNSAIHVPLTSGGELIGSLSVRSRDRNFYGQSHFELARQIGSQISGSVANAELHAITEREAEERLVLAEMGRLVSSSLNAQEIFESIAGPFKRLIPCDRFSVATFDSSTSEWTPRYVDGDVVGGYQVGESHVDSSALGSRVAVEQDVVILDGGEEADQGPLVDRFRDAGFLSTLIVPLVVSGETIGALSARSIQPGAYNDRYADLAARIALQVTGAVANSELHRALLDSEAQTRAVVETAAVGIVTADETLAIQTVNDAVLQAFGYSREELVGQHVSILAAEPYRSEHRSYEARYHETGDPRIIGILREVVGRKKDGTTFPLELEVSRVDMEHGTMYTGVMRDITDRKRAEAQLAELTVDLERRVLERTEQLQETNTELEAFSYTVSHDLRGPLAMSARLAARLLELSEDQLPEQARRYVELIARSSDESSQLVSDLLNFARLGHQALEVKEIDPSRISAAVIGDLRESNPHIEWTVHEMPLCRADEGLLRIVYVNLLGNAVKFTSSADQPRVEIGAIELEDDHAFYVRDNGVGFDMDQAERMFEVFERLHRPEDYPGTGAGLAIVRRIIERHGGRVWAESETGQGATFFFTLPSTA